MISSALQVAGVEDRGKPWEQTVEDQRIDLYGSEAKTFCHLDLEVDLDHV